MKRRIRLSDTQQRDAVTRYIAGESPPKIANALGVCANNVRNTLRHCAVTLRNRSEACTVYRHWEQAFDILTPESEYWIGFLFADGWIYRGIVGSPVIAIGLAERDIDHLTKFRAAINANHPISKHRSTIRGKTHPGVRFSLRSTKLAAALETHGMCKKSLKRVASPGVAKSRDFWRGVVDGDGYVGLPNREPRLGVCGGNDLMNQFLSFMQAYKIGMKTNVRQQGKIYIVAFTKRSAVSAIDLLYRNASCALERKNTRAQQILMRHV